MRLATKYLGLTLASPLVASASPLNLDLGNIRRLEDAGAGAVVLPSLFQEQIEQEELRADRLTEASQDINPEAASYFPAASIYRAGPQQYLELLQRAREAVDMPIIASLNGYTDGGWTDYARQIQGAGAHALELNLYSVPTDPALDGRDVEDQYLDTLAAVRAAVSIPIAVKLPPYFSALCAMVHDLERAGADGFVLFNRFYQPDIDLARLTLKRDLALSTKVEIRLPLLWIGVLAGRMRASLAASSGVETVDEVLKFLLAGADVVMTTSALLRNGVDYMKVLVAALEAWLDSRKLDSLSGLRGRLSLSAVDDATAFERANYIQILQGWKG
jgi:dihydroorotate dehydrogenase (fumarate)